MIIKKYKKKSLINKFYKIYFISSIFFVFFAIVTFLNTGIWQNYKDEINKRIYLNGISNYKYIPNIIFLISKNIFSNLDDFSLEIDQENILIIENNRKNKINNQKINFIPAEAFIELNGEKIKTNIRLKGDRKIHYENRKKSSYKFNLKKDKAYKNLTSFSIQKPRIRNYIHEWVFHNMAKELNLVSLEYDFVNFKINGENKGLFVIEESFSNTLIEKNNRRAGPIFGLDEEYEMNDFFSAKLDPYQNTYWNRPENIEIFLIAKKKLTELQNSNKNINEIIDIKKWSDYFVLCDLLYMHHGLLPKSVKFYYNPITALFEPIPFDGHKMPAYDFSPKIEKYFNKNTSFDIALKNSFNSDHEKYFSNWLKLFFFKNKNELNNEFFSSYKESLRNITDEKFLTNFFKKNKKFIDKINAKIYLDDFQFDYDTERKKGLGIYYFNFDNIIFRSNELREKNRINLNKISFEDKFNKIEIFNKDLNNNMLILKKVICYSKNKKTLETNIGQKKLLIKNKQNYIDKKKFSLLNLNCKKIVLYDEYENKEYIKNINPNLFLERNNKVENNLNKYFIKKDNNLFFKEKDILIDKNLFIPDGFNVVVNPNQIIRLINKSIIFSKSNWNFNGKKNKPILISGYRNNFGGGIFINSKEKTYMNNVNVENLIGPEIGNINDNINNLASRRIYGAINFYNTNVQISNLNFLNIYSEDALNIINSNFKIDDCKFSNIKSDAIDFDFSNGEISDLQFENIYNDALDFSGSNVKIKNVKAKSVKDKVISAGENSILEIDNLNAYNSFIGIANKDGSKLVLKNSLFDYVEMPLAGYLKKNFYDMSRMQVKNSNFKNFNNKYMLSEKSHIFIDGIKLIKNKKNKNILKIIYQ